MIRCIQKFSELIRSAGGLQQAQQQSQTLSGKQQAHRPAHALLCPGGCSSGDPLYELDSLAERHPSDALFIAAALVATAVAEGRPASWLEAWADDSFVCSSGGSRWADGGEGEGEGSEDEEPDCAAEEGWALLHTGVLSRLPAEARALAAPLLDPGLFARLLAAVERRVLPLQAAAAGGEVHEATAQLDALLALEAADSEDGLPPHAGADAPAAAVTARRLVCLLSQQTLRVSHSCLPRSQLQLEPHADAPPAMPRARLVPLRPLAAAEEPPSLAWVPTANASLEERAAALRARFGASFACACERCSYEARGGSVGAPLVALARDAMEDGRLAAATAMLRARVSACRTDGDAWMLLGTALLGSERWTAAHEAWRAGAELAPHHALLGRQCRKDRSYRADGVAAAAGGAEGAAPCEVHALAGGGPACKVVVSRSPLFSAVECERAVAAAEAHAAKSGGWTTSRHRAVPTTDVPVHEVPELLRWFNHAMAGRIAPLLAAQFRVAAADIRVHDAFLVRYSASGGQAHLPLHTDESVLSLTVVLNDEFEGGGTFFADLRRSLSPPVGHLVAFHGRALHGGEPIVSGVRYIVAAFLYVAVEEPAAAPPLPELFAGCKRARRDRGDDAMPAGGGGGEAETFCFGF
ncbi:hypothetical protein EMIHUDRAFT_108627 [Emiliania huxleyi CCMP1516]|uniref:Fe2OG dioxygenase domain-containing protein n=2 Tax=Emiliania huxleyi TaxID=2903 RepID=A0A0D3KWI1_EMIH1|nr:hypothetical protein EMIHUDRAFT_108627 [Emiliania huxleyi CCMP1516]EOD40116.1 hypothetical protein EMIHUDRAFT_108627 [Emiliania huxleyi CCMP1516]|eukprot:XP_005792545.1 hypothetical protein EMIHUDRAFT_108627 [Emiliania huxleyi CCMP1516]